MKEIFGISHLPKCFLRNGGMDLLNNYRDDIVSTARIRISI